MLPTTGRVDSNLRPDGLLGLGTHFSSPVRGVYLDPLWSPKHAFSLENRSWSREDVEDIRDDSDMMISLQ